MAKSEKPFLEAMDTVELKKELHKAMQEIVEEDEYTLEATDHAMQALSALKVLKLKLLESQQSLPPREFFCPISKELMRDPVVIASGLTFDRAFIEKWLNDGHRTCPQSQQVLSHMVLTPNLILRGIIFQWCREHEVEMPSLVQEIEGEITTNADQGHFNSLFGKLSSSYLTDQKAAAKEIRALTKGLPCYRALFAEIPDGIPNFLKALSLGTETDPDLLEDLIAIVLNLSVHDGNKKPIADNPIVIPLLIESLTLENIETRRNAAAAISSLSEFDSNKSLIGELGALKPLIELLEGGNPLVVNDATAAIYNLCTAEDNRARAVSEGAVRVIMQKISDGLLVDELLPFLAWFSFDEKGIEEMGELGAVSCLLGILRGETSQRNKESSIAILYTMCCRDRAKLREISEEEDANGTISKLSQTGTSRAKRKATSILGRIERYGSSSNTAWNEGDSRSSN